jgi:hypothetical protein
MRASCPQCRSPCAPPEPTTSVRPRDALRVRGALLRRYAGSGRRAGEGARGDLVRRQGPHGETPPSPTSRSSTARRRRPRRLRGRGGDALARRFPSLSTCASPRGRWRGSSATCAASAVGHPTPRPAGNALRRRARPGQPGRRRRGPRRDGAAAPAPRSWRGRGPARRRAGHRLENVRARALYERSGFEVTGVHEAPDARVAAAVGGPGFVSYVKTL